MGSNSPKPLSVAEAKERLRAACENANPMTWVRRKPIESVLTALAAGVLAGLSARSRKEIIEAITRILEMTTVAASREAPEQERPEKEEEEAEAP